MIVWANFVFIQIKVNEGKWNYLLMMQSKWKLDALRRVVNLVTLRDTMGLTRNDCTIASMSMIYNAINAYSRKIRVLLMPYV